LKCGNSNINTKGVAFWLPLILCRKNRLPDNSETSSA
jgi:hypothetical protein